MSAINEVLAEKVEQLTEKNNMLTTQNERLAKLLAESLGVLKTFGQNAEDKLRHYELCQGTRDKYDWRKLLNR